jgi:hypothetical protein
LRWPLGEGSARTSIGVATFPADATYALALAEASRRGMHAARAAGGAAIAAAPPAGEIPLLRVDSPSVRIVVRLHSGDEPAVTVPREGLRFVSPLPYPVGVGVDLDCIEVNGTGRTLLRGRVVLLEERPEGGFEVGVACRVHPAEALLQPGESPPAK